MLELLAGGDAVRRKVDAAIYPGAGRPDRPSRREQRRPLFARLAAFVPLVGGTSREPREVSCRQRASEAAAR